VDVAGGVNGQPGDLFGGIDATMTGLQRFSMMKPPSLTAGLQTIAGAAAEAERALTAAGPSGTIAPLAAGLRAVRELRQKLASLQWSPQGTYAGPPQPWMFDGDA